LNDHTTPLVGIFADDLTGALDAAAPFAARGFSTVVSPTEELPIGSNRAEVISVNLGTRHLSSSEIFSRTSQAVSTLVGLGVKVLLNKVDSTLRGNPGVELVAALETLNGDHAVLCSAYPQNGRTIEGGVLLVGGVPVAETDVGQDQLSPLPSSRVDEIVSASLERAGVPDKVHVQGAEGGAAITDLLPVLITLNARTEAELGILAERLVDTPTTALVAGSAGISVALADVLDMDRFHHRTPSDVSGLIGQKVLIVTASQRQIVDAQIELLGNQIDIVHAELSVDEALAGVTDESIERMIDVAQRVGVVVLRLGTLSTESDLSTGDLQSMAKTIVGNIGAAVRRVTDAAKPDTLVVIGGDTAAGVLEACGVSSLKLRGELQPGTVSGVPVDGTIADTLLITRAGGFGDENSLFELLTLLEFGHNV
jgi:D-threonate/D-erythronate kinase